MIGFKVKFKELEWDGREMRKDTGIIKVGFIIDAYMKENGYRYYKIMYVDRYY